MAKSVANLSISLTARIGNFEKGMRRAQRIATRFASDVAGHVVTIAKYGAALTGVAAGAAAYFVKGQLEAADATSKLSRTLGLSTEQLTGYQHAASLAGVDSDKLAAAILRVNKSADASMAGLSTDQRLLAVADQYSSIGNAADRAQFLAKKFGKAGLELGALFEQGSAGIMAARKEAEALGLSFSTIDGVAIENANDAVTRLQSAITGVARRIAVQLAPFIEAASNRLLAFAQAGNISGESVINGINGIITAIGRMADMLELAKAGWHGFVAIVSQAGGVVAQTSRLFSMNIKNMLAALGLRDLKASDIEMEDMLKAMASGFADSTIDALAKAEAAMGRFAKSSNSKALMTLFEKLKLEAQKFQDAAALSVPNVADSLGSSASAKTAEFREIDPNRVAIGGQSALKDKTINHDQGETIIERLGQIAQNTRSRALIV